MRLDTQTGRMLKQTNFLVHTPMMHFASRFTVFYVHLLQMRKPQIVFRLI